MPARIVETPADLLECVHGGIEYRVDLAVVDREWPVLCTAQADDLIAEGDGLRIWLSRATMAERLEMASMPDDLDEVGSLEWYRQGHWESEPWRITWHEWED